MALPKSSGICPCKSVKVIEKLRAILSSGTSEKSSIFATIRYYIGNCFLISHSSGDIPLLVGLLENF
jgi:hypothetical protein